MTTTPMTVALQIGEFCYCKGCIKEVKKALGKLGVKLSDMDPEMGLFVMLTTALPDAIKDAVKQQFPTKAIRCVYLQDAATVTPLQAPEVNITPSAPPLPTTPDDQVYGYPLPASPGLVYGYPLEDAWFP